MNKIKVLVIDDSTVFRSQVRLALQDVEGVEVVGSASNGAVALDQIALCSPDLLTLDLEMPVMDGVQTIQEMRKRGFRQKIIVFASTSRQSSEATRVAMRLGASDYLCKPKLRAIDAANGKQPSDLIRDILVPKIRRLQQSGETAPVPDLSPFEHSNDDRGSDGPDVESAAPRTAPNGVYPSIIWDLFNPKIIVIGSSTGGPNALEEVFSHLRGPVSCPIFITQHMPPIFTASLAERLEKLSGIPAAEAKHLEVAKPNRIYVAPGDYHMSLGTAHGGLEIHLDQGPLQNSVRPAVDPLFLSAARNFKERCLGIVLTGMGEDGRIGAQAVKQHGGAIVIQSAESCVVFGMPGAIFRDGAYDRVGDLKEISDLLKDKVG